MVSDVVEWLEEWMFDLDEDVGNFEGCLIGMEYSVFWCIWEEIDLLFVEVEVLGILVK